MTAEDITKLVNFTVIDYGEQESKLATVSVTIERHAVITNVLAESCPGWKAFVAKNLTEEILRELYDDQRQLLYHALYDLLAANPMDMDSMLKAKSDLLKAAMRQQPLPV